MVERSNVKQHNSFLHIERPKTTTITSSLESDPPTSIQLTVTHLSKTYMSFHGFRQRTPPPLQALNDVNFSLAPGLYGLLGPNGAGKSTLINIIIGSLMPTTGQVYWCGQNIRNLGIQYRRILGYMPQQQGLYDRYSGRDFLLYMAALKGIDGRATLAAVENASAEVNLSDQLEKRLSAYSGGMKQRLLVAAAILGDPKLLIMDEPTAGLDPKERVRLRQLMTTLAKTRVVLVATHVVSDVESTADQILLLRAGHLVDMASPASLIKKYAPGKGLEEVYLHIFGEDNI